MKTFEGYLDLYNFIKGDEDLKQEEVFSPFFNACAKIDKGCKCSKQKRIDAAVSAYLSLPVSITGETLEKIKLHFQVSTIQFKHNGGLFYEA